MDPGGALQQAALSRQFISMQGLQIKCIPFAGPTKPAMHDSLSEHKLLAVGCWNEDLQVHPIHPCICLQPCDTCNPAA